MLPGAGHISHRVLRVLAARDRHSMEGVLALLDHFQHQAALNRLHRMDSMVDMVTCSKGSIMGTLREWGISSRA